MNRNLVLSIVGIAALCSVVALASAPTGAIFTTLPDGTRVNANIYDSKSDVYLDGGPNGTQTPAAALDDGIYVFQVTDPSGKVLLSTDAAKCRLVEVVGGVIMYQIDWDGGTTFTRHTTPPGGDKCHREGQSKNKHDTNPDSDNPGVNDIVVQLMPYDDTPNPGGVYKAWMTKVEDYVCSLNDVDCGYNIGSTYFHGFVPSDSKTDNFKVREKGGKPQPTITAHKYCDVACNGTQDPGDACLNGVLMTIKDSTGATVCSGTTVGGFFSCKLSATGIYTVTETLGGGLYVCGASVDDGLGGGPVAYGKVTTVSVNIVDSKQNAIVSFGNGASDGAITATKVCGNDGSYIANWPMSIAGTAVDGTPVYQAGATGASGSVTFGGLKAGVYTVTEGSVAGFIQVPPTSCTKTITTDTSLDAAGNPQCTNNSESCSFTNIAVGDVGARTPGFWCVQVRRALGENPSEYAACYQRLNCEYGSIQTAVDNGFAYWTTTLGGAGSLFDLDNSGSVSLLEAQQIFCPQAGDAEHHQCRRQFFSTLMNVANQVTSATNGTCGSACDTIGVSTTQKIYVNGAITTVGNWLNSVPTDGSCSQSTWDVAQGINENTITLTPSCPAIP